MKVTKKERKTSIQFFFSSKTESLKFIQYEFMKVTQKRKKNQQHDNTI